MLSSNMKRGNDCDTDVLHKDGDNVVRQNLFICVAYVWMNKESGLVMKSISLEIICIGTIICQV
jgi:hypothetical protein